MFSGRKLAKCVLEGYTSSNLTNKLHESSEGRKLQFGCTFLFGFFVCFVFSKQYMAYTEYPAS